ncbi:MAG: hypothetical protein ACP5O4_04630, partial [bacterium]
MIVNSPNIQLKISPNLKYIALLHGNSLLLYRERTFLFEKNVKGLDLKLIAVSDKGDVLVQTQSELILIDLNQQETILNNKFKEGGILSDFNLLNKKIFFYRKTQDKSFLNILAKKEVYLHELGMLNLETSKEEIFFSKKMESNDNIEFKLSPFSNYIIIKDKKIVEKINLSNYKVELSYELSDIQIVDYYINNSGDIVFYIRDKDKEALYFISNNSKFIIKLPEEVKDSIIISFNPNKIVLRLKTYPQIFILNKLGNIELKFLLNDIENLNYPMWAVLFPTYEDIIALYLRQFKLPLDMFYFTYENFRVEVSRWRVTEFKKAKTEDKLASLLEESIKEREQIIEQKSKEIEKFQKEILKHHKEDIQQQTQGVTEKAVVDSEKLMKLTFDSVESKVENIDTSKLVNLFKEENQQEEQETKGVLNKLEDQSQDQKNIYKKVVSEDELLKKALSETKEQAKSINYDISKLTKFLEEDSNEENNSEIINKLGNEDEQVKKPKLKIDFDKVLYDKEQTIKEKETKKLDLNTILTDEPKNEIKKDLNSPKSIESPKKLVIEEFEKLLENVENKIEKSQKIESK